MTGLLYVRLNHGTMSGEKMVKNLTFSIFFITRKIMIRTFTVTPPLLIFLFLVTTGIPVLPSFLKKKTIANPISGFQ